MLMLQTPEPWERYVQDRTKRISQQLHGLHQLLLLIVEAQPMMFLLHLLILQQALSIIFIESMLRRWIRQPVLLPGILFLQIQESMPAIIHLRLQSEMTCI